MLKNSGQSPVTRSSALMPHFSYLNFVLYPFKLIYLKIMSGQKRYEKCSARLSAGQSLVELIIAISIAGIIISSAAGGILMVIRSNEIAGKTQVAASLAVALSDNLVSMAEGNWNNIYGLSKGSANKYYVATSTGQFVVQSGTEQVTVNSFPFSRYFYIENAERDGGGAIGSGTDDPSTQKATVVVSYNISGSERTITESFYLTRWRNNSLRQTDWSGGSGQEGPITSPNNKFSSFVNVDFSAVSGSLTLADSDEDGELNSSIFDTGISGGVGFNTLMWQGIQTSGKVKFKFASSNDPGSWNWAGRPIISPAGPNVQIRINPAIDNNKRYFRYKIILEGESSVRIDDVIVNYSP